MSKEIQIQIDEILVSNNVSFSVQYLGVKEKALDSDTGMDEWRITFSTDKSKEIFEFCTGMGHRKWDKPYSSKVVLPHGVKSYPYTYKDLGKEGTVHYENMARANLKPVCPHATDLLYCIVLDSEACDYSFKDWCENFGYDEDSRKALKIYLQCQENGEKLRKIFKNETLEQIKSLLQDY